VAGVVVVTILEEQDTEIGILAEGYVCEVIRNSNFGK